MPYLKLGDRNNDVTKLQRLLVKRGFSVQETGTFDPSTLRAVMDFQKSSGLEPDGIAGTQTHRALEGLPVTNYDRLPKNRPSWTESALNDRNDEYVRDVTHKTRVLLCGTGTPASCRAALNAVRWSRGQSTSSAPRAHAFYVAGAPDSSAAGTLGTHADGDIVRCYDEKYWSRAVNAGKMSDAVNSSSVSIALCSWGGLEINDAGQAVTRCGTVVPDSEVCDLGRVWRGHRYHHAYTDRQLESMVSLVRYALDRFSIRLPRTRYTQSWWFDVSSDAVSSGGLWNEACYDPTTDGLSPQKNLIRALNSI